MDKMQYPRGLIRDATPNGMREHLDRKGILQRVLRPRVLLYSAILVLICAALFASIWLRKPFKVDVVRDRGAMARVVDDGWVENVYRLQIMNATESVQRYRLNASGLPQMATDLRGDIIVEPAQARWVAIAVRVPPEAAAAAGPGSHVMHFLIERVQETPGDSSATLQEKSTFMVPR